MYESVLRRHVPKYDHLVHTRINYGTLAEFFDESSFEANPLLNRQILKVEGLIRRVESSAYVPSPDQPVFAVIVDEVTTLFYDNQTNGTVNVDYKTDYLQDRCLALSHSHATPN